MDDGIAFLKSKGISLETPEDIEKWRQERRANYPRFGSTIKHRLNDVSHDTPIDHNICKDRKRFKAHHGIKKPTARFDNSKCDTNRSRRISLYDKMLLAEVYGKEEKIMKCLRTLVNSWDERS